jgi:RHS repeat-associated protein
VAGFCVGAKQKATELPSGIVAMGARVYNPYTGTFLQPDPVFHGGATAYGYTNGDPVNATDLSGDITMSAETALTIAKLLGKLDETSDLIEGALKTAVGVKSAVYQAWASFNASGGFKYLGLTGNQLEGIANASKALYGDAGEVSVTLSHGVTAVGVESAESTLDELGLALKESYEDFKTVETDCANETGEPC